MKKFIGIAGVGFFVTLIALVVVLAVALIRFENREQSVESERAISEPSDALEDERSSAADSARPVRKAARRRLDGSHRADEA